MNARIGGIVEWRKRGQPWQRCHNLVTDEGIDYLIDHSLDVPGSFAAGEPTLYIALWNTNVTELPDLTGATFAAVAGEINSITEGFVETTRPEWVGRSDISLADNERGNVVSPAEFNIRTATQLTVYGIALLTTDVIGDVAGALISMARFTDGPALLDDHDILDIRYIVSAFRA
jgi:hypothetical protein